MFSLRFIVIASTAKGECGCTKDRGKPLPGLEEEGRMYVSVIDRYPQMEHDEAGKLFRDI